MPVGLPSDLLQRRPDIRRAERQYAAATARIGAATADLFPRFSLTGSFGFQSEKPAQLFNWTSRFWSVGPAISWPIFDAGRIRWNIQVQGARQEQALAQYQKTVLVALQDVEDSLIAYANEATRHQSLVEAVNANRRARDLATVRYRGGLENFLTVLDAERSLLVAEDQLAQGERDLSANIVAVYKSLGGGWEALENPPTTRP